MCLQSKHAGLVDAFEEACKTSGKKRNANCLDESGSSQPTIRESLSSKRQNTIISQTQFDELVLDYIIGSLLPIRHVDTPQFIEYSNGISSGSTKFTLNCWFFLDQMLPFSRSSCNL